MNLRKPFKKDITMAPVVSGRSLQLRWMLFGNSKNRNINELPALKAIFQNDERKPRTGSGGSGLVHQESSARPLHMCMLRNQDIEVVGRWRVNTTACRKRFGAAVLCFRFNTTSSDRLNFFCFPAPFV